MNSQSKQISALLKRTSLSLMLLLCLLVLRSTPAYAICAVHDHNCFHGTEPFNPALADIQTGTGNLTITSTWTGEGDANLHVSLPDNVDQYGNPIYGPFVASNGDGNPVTGSPLGTNPNVLYHGQQTIQWVNASSLANLTSDSQPASPTATITRTDKAVISGNVPSGQYDFALHSYDERMVNVPVTVSTIAKAGSGAYFLNQGAQSAAQQAAGHNPISNATGTSTQLSYSHTLGATGSVSATETFTYRYPGFSDHANGVYVIPDGVWNMHGVDPQQVYQFASADRSQGFILNQGYQFEMNPFDTQPVDIYGYNNWFFDANSGVYLALNEQGGFDRVAVNPGEFSTVQTALYVPVEIMQQYDIDNISGSSNRGHVRGFSNQNYDRARALIGCPQCSGDRLFEIERQIRSGQNTYGLNEEQQQQYLDNIIKGYSAASYYRSIKDDYRRGQLTNYAGQVINVGVQYASGGVVSFGMNYQGDTTYGDANSIIIPGHCEQPPCNGRSQNDLAASFGVSRFSGTDIVRVDSVKGTIQVNDGPEVEASIYDVAGDGKEAPVKTLDVKEGGNSYTVGVGYKGFGASVTKGPDGTSYGASFGAEGFSVGINCQSGGDCSQRVAYTPSVGVADGILVSGGLYYDTQQGVGATAGITYQDALASGKNGYVGLQAGYDTNSGMSGGLSFTRPEDYYFHPTEGHSDEKINFGEDELENGNTVFNIEKISSDKIFNNDYGSDIEEIVVYGQRIPSTPVGYSGINAIPPNEKKWHFKTLTPINFSKKEKEAILAEIASISEKIMSQQYDSYDAAALALHYSGLVEYFKTLGIEGWAVIDRNTFAIKQVSTGFYSHYAVGVYDGKYTYGDVVWHTHPTGSGAHVGDFDSAISAYSKRIYASGDSLQYINSTVSSVENTSKKIESVTEFLKYKGGFSIKIVDVIRKTTVTKKFLPEK